MRVVEVARLGEHRADWDDLVSAMALPSPFLRSWWLDAVDTGASSYVLVLDGDRLAGGVPLESRRVPALTIYRFVGHGVLCPDHLDVVAAPSDLAGVTDALAAWARRPGSRLFDLAGLAEHSRIPAWLPAARTHELDAAPVGPLPSSAEDYLAARPRSFRKTVRRARNRLADQAATIRPVTADEIAPALDAFERLHRARGDRGDLLAELPRLRRAVTAGVAIGEAWVDALATDGTTLAVSIGFLVQGRVSLYQTARLPDAAADNASTVLNLAAIDAAIGSGATEVDLLRGQEPYKRHYADGARRLFRTRGAHGVLGRALLVAITLVRRVRAELLSRAPRASAGESGS